MTGIKRRNEDMHLKSDPENVMTGKDESRSEAEKDLWLRCSNGDEEAREELILAYRPMVYWLAKKLKVHYGTYPDLIQEGMVSLINAVDRFEVKRNNCFSTYAYYKIKGGMINFIQRVEAKAPIPVDDEVFINEAPLAASLSEHADRTEWTLDLEQAMNSLSQREADIVKALVIEGRAAKEVAEEADLDISHIYRIRRKAIAKLRKWLKADEATSAM
ncbi:MAG: sigma-70 family RNA polymerase sigma factor [Synergistaceae bacterium]|nr:sigma-70 family RNA polymerase sigma factor [Synergistaceae bacterium]